MKKVIALVLLVLSAVGGTRAQRASLQRNGAAAQLVVGGKPFVVLGGELGNSSATCTGDIEQTFPKLQRMGLNTVLVPACWDLIEPEEGRFDFGLTDTVLKQARANGLKVIFLWFGAWKNSMSCYAPLWFKRDYKKYPRAVTESGKPLEIADVFSEAVFQADHKAFSSWMEHVAEADKDFGTVIMVQIENEIGMLESARSHSVAANAAFSASVPSALTSYLKKNKKRLHPQMLAKWESRGCCTEGNWHEVFGQDVYTDEIFMAWHYASYVERMARTARRIYNVPLFVNAALNSRGRRPGEYPSAGPLAHLRDVWRCAAPTVDILAPDIYDTGFKQWVAQYDMPGNPLFIPEIRFADNCGVRAFYAVAEHGALGFSPFSVENGSKTASAVLSESYAKLRELTPLVARHRGMETMRGLLFDSEDKECTVDYGDMTLTARHFFTLPWDPRATDGSEWPECGGLVIKLADNEYIVAGSGIVVEFLENAERTAMHNVKKIGEDGFALSGNNHDADGEENLKRIGKSGYNSTTRVGIGTVDEVEVMPNGTLRYLRRHNGDQTHQGRHVRIGVDDWKILHVKLYKYK